MLSLMLVARQNSAYSREKEREKHSVSPYGVALEQLRQHPLFSHAFPKGTRWARIPTQLPVFNAPTRTCCVKASSETRAQRGHGKM